MQGGCCDPRIQPCRFHSNQHHPAWPWYVQDLSGGFLSVSQWPELKMQEPAPLNHAPGMLKAGCGDLLWQDKRGGRIGR